MIPGLPDHATESIIGILRVHPAISRAVLFGSRAMGSYRPGSDIDLMIESDELPHGEYLSLLNEIDDLLLPWQCDIIRSEQISNDALREHIARVGIIVYSRN